VIPETIRQHRPKGTEIRYKGGHYYVYKVKAFWDREAKKPKRRSLGCIGQIYEGVGFVPNDKVVKDPLSVTKEYGASRTILVLTASLFESIRKHFPSDFLRIYVLAAIKLLERDLTSRRAGWAYERSALSLLLPEVHLSKNTVAAFIERLSLMRGEMVELMRTLCSSQVSSVIFDGTSMLSAVRDNPYTEKGYSPGKRSASQVRLIYAFEKVSRRPIYFNVVPGSVSDMTALVSSFSDLGLSNCVMILDNGFFSDNNIKAMLAGEDIHFIIPLKDNTTLVPSAYKPYISYKDVIGDSFSYHGRFVFFRELTLDKYANCNVFIYYDERRNKDLEKERIKKAKALYGETLPKEVVAQLYKECEMLGVTMLMTNGASSAEETFLDYKARWAIEAMFDTMKNTLSFTMNYETSYEAQMGWAFIEFLSLSMYYEIDRVLKEKGLHKNYSVGDVLFDLRCIEQSNSNVDGKWRIANLSKRRKELLEALGVTLELISKPADFTDAG